MNRRTTKEEKDTIKKMVRNGYGYKRIASALNLQRGTVRYWALQFKPNSKKVKDKRNFEKLFKRGFKVSAIAPIFSYSKKTLERWKLEKFGNRNYRVCKAIELYKKGVSMDDIAVFLNMSNSYLNRIVKEYCPQIEPN
jgi:transposase